MVQLFPFNFFTSFYWCNWYYKFIMWVDSDMSLNCYIASWGHFPLDLVGYTYINFRINLSWQGFINQQQIINPLNKQEQWCAT